MMHEASLYKTNSFLTLTYREPRDCTTLQLKDRMHVPESGSLRKSDHQKFIKRLRKKFPENRLRYYHAGEYGDENNRPHYHTALFNLGFNDEKLYSKNDGYPLFTSKTLEDLWGYGFATVGDLGPKACAYISGYILKKMTGTGGHEHYQREDEYGQSYWLVPEYSTMSNGLGKEWFEKYHGDCFPSDDMHVPGVGIVRGIPRYYEEIMEDINPETMEEVKKIRRTFAAAHPELYTPEKLQAQYKIYRANQQRKRRNKV